MIPTNLIVLTCMLPCVTSKLGRHTLFGPGLQGAAGGVVWHLTGGVSYSLLPRRCARHRFLPAAKDFYDAHGSAAAGARFAQGEWYDLGVAL